jgi:hypothetical protein
MFYNKHARRFCLEKRILLNLPREFSRGPSGFFNHFLTQVAVSELQPPLRNRLRSETAKSYKFITVTCNNHSPTDISQSRAFSGCYLSYCASIVLLQGFDLYLGRVLEEVAATSTELGTIGCARGRARRAAPAALSICKQAPRLAEGGEPPQATALNAVLLRTRGAIGAAKPRSREVLFIF